MHQTKKIMKEPLYFPHTFFYKQQNLWDWKNGSKRNNTIYQWAGKPSMDCSKGRGSGTFMTIS